MQSVLSNIERGYRTTSFFFQQVLQLIDDITGDISFLIQEYSSVISDFIGHDSDLPLFDNDNDTPQQKLDYLNRTLHHQLQHMKELHQQLARSTGVEDDDDDNELNLFHLTPQKQTVVKFLVIEKLVGSLENKQADLNKNLQSLFRSDSFRKFHKAVATLHDFLLASSKTYKLPDIAIKAMMALSKQSNEFQRSFRLLRSMIPELNTVMQHPFTQRNSQINHQLSTLVGPPAQAPIISMTKKI